MAAALSRWARRILPFFVVRFALRLFFRAEIRGIERLAAAGPRVLIVANHVSSLDAVVLSALLPGRMLFATHAEIAQRWWLKPYWRIGDDCSLDQAHPMTAKTMVDALKRGRVCMIFPEGRPTTTGALMKVYESPGMIADKADAAILPIRIEGLEYSYFSMLGGVVRRRLFPKVTLTVLPPQRLRLPKDIKGHKRRVAAGAQLYDMMERLPVDGVDYKTILHHVLATRPIRGGRGDCLEDADRRTLTHDAFVRAFLALSRPLQARLDAQEKTVGVMMLNGLPDAVSIFAIQALGLTVAMINFTSGPEYCAKACATATVKTVVTLRSFVAAGAMAQIAETLRARSVSIVYYEDLVAAEGWAAKTAALVKSRAPPGWIVGRLGRNADDPALILFTSGTEGAPKGVALSHRNIVANAFQFGARIGFAAHDKVFACLPMFHSFGVTLGFFMPLLYGARAFLYFSPLRYHEIPELIYDTGATLLLGTDTFLSNYARTAHPHDLYFLRFAIGGAEKIKPETRQIWSEKFGVRLFEGYGTTEASPVVSANAPMYYKAGSVGRPVPTMQVRLDPVDGVKDGAELAVKGPNVMLGYIRHTAPGVIEPVKDGWYKTGDIASIDEGGFITLLGRVKRFAKIAGEMVSLAAVEAAVAARWPDSRHTAVEAPDARKGEVVVLLTESDEVDVGLLPDHFRLHGLTELSLPRKIIRVAQIPLLGSGKVDFVRVRELAQQEGGDESSDVADEIAAD
jgi:acyl-[acyl-carrier-protein]-phospholipid O-acyltransferase/long-chain-fatty-acid--[acyl-carrier-protein] ligase